MSEDILQNHLLRALPADSLDRLTSSLKFVILRQGQTIDRAGEPARHIYLVSRGYISFLKKMRDGHSVEVGGVGIEGMTAPTAVLGRDATAILDSVVQIPGTAFRIDRTVLHWQAVRDPLLHLAVTGYLRFLLGQIAQTAACNRLHSIRKRCARWLLVAHDNALSDRFPLTHELLAVMLGGQRAGVSLAAHRLKRAGLIDYARGVITIRDRKGLQDVACECYPTSHNEIRHLYDDLRAG